MKRPKLIAHIALISSNLIFGFNYVISKGIMPNYFKPQDIVFYRIFGALLLFWIYSLFFKAEKIDKKDYFRFFLCGLFGVFINQYMFFEGLNLTSPIDASIIQISNPVIVLLLAYFMVKERLTASKITGLFLAGLGALMVVFESNGSSSKESSMLGNGMILINAISYALYIVLSKPLVMKYQTHTLMKWFFTTGAVLVFPFVFFLSDTTDYYNYPIHVWGSMIYIILATTFLAYLLVISSMKELSPSVVGVYIYSQPFIASIFALWLGMGSLSVIKVFAACLIFAGVYLVSKSKKKEVFSK